jgi:glycosyltransferase involved in cell wall biosynthesis
MSKNFFNRIIISILKKVEYKVFKSAISINFVSPGFQEFFISNNIRFKEISLFTNGLDDIFNKENNVTFVNSIKKILYVGNIGEGQGLHNFIPEVAHELREIEFILVGDGGKKKELEENLKKKNINNVKILKPRLQTELINIYKNTDILLLNLNNFNSLKYVIPSKIFEYASFNKPIIAGVDGYTKKFCKKFNNITFFEPSNPKNFIKILNELSKKLPIKTLSNHSYLIEFQRSLLMRKYVMYIKQKLYEKNYYSI